MRNQYVVQTGRWLTKLFISGIILNVRAQSAQPNQIQWQRVIEGGDLGQSATVQATAAGSKGDYGVLAGKNLIRLSVAGAILWNKPVAGAYQDSSSNRVPVQQTIALAATQDEGFLVLAQDVQNRYYVTKSDATGKSTWTKTIDRANAGATVRITANALVAAPDGSFLVVGAYTDRLSYLTLTKLNQEGTEAGRWRIRFSDASQASPTISQILPTPDKGYLLIGSAAHQGIALKIDAQYNLVWQNTYPAVTALTHAVANPQAEGNYTAIGSGTTGNAQAVTVAPNKSGDGTLMPLFPGLSAPTFIAGGVANTITLLDAAGVNNGEFRLTNGDLPPAIRWTRTFGGSGRDIPTALLATADGGYLAVGTTTSTDRDVVGKSGSTIAAWVVKLGVGVTATTLRLQTPIYDCASGFIIFTTTGGDGSPITYTATGVTHDKPTDNFGKIEQELRNDPKVITIQATQGGQTVSYAFDLATYCPNRPKAGSTASADTLKLIAPTYNCETGAITFRSIGGDGSPVEYMAAGITNGWTTNPSQFVNTETRTANDAQPLVLMARQNGRTATYLFNVKAACGRARIGASEPTADLRVRLLGNPVREVATVEITGAEGQALLLNLLDAQGRPVEQRKIEQAGASERQTFDVHQQSAGTMLLHTTVNGQFRTVKVVKQ